MPTLDFLITAWSVRPISALFVLSIGLLYSRGWLRLRSRQERRIATARLVSFGLGWLLLVVALFSPLFVLRTELLLARTTQQILLGLLAAPLLWLGAPAQTMRWGLPAGLRRSLTGLLRRERATGQAVRSATRPTTVWLLTFGSFLVWADPAFVQWTVTNDGRYSLSLWFFFFVYLLFWMHVVPSGPRLHRAVQPGIGFLYVLFGGEVPNVVTGITLAFRQTLVYPVYAAGSTTTTLAPLMDQAVSGCLIWVMGSVIYISLCLSILGRAIRNEDAPPPMPLSWDATERTIAPGLEHRVSARKTVGQ